MKSMKKFTIPMVIYGYAVVKAGSLEEAIDFGTNKIFPYTWVKIDGIDFRVNDTETFDDQIEEI